MLYTTATVTVTVTDYLFCAIFLAVMSVIIDIWIIIVFPVIFVLVFCVAFFFRNIRMKSLMSEKFEKYDFGNILAISLYLLIFLCWCVLAIPAEVDADENTCYQCIAESGTIWRADCTPYGGKKPPRFLSYQKRSDSSCGDSCSNIASSCRKEARLLCDSPGSAHHPGDNWHAMCMPHAFFLCAPYGSSMSLPDYDDPNSYRNWEVCPTGYRCECDNWAESIPESIRGDDPYYDCGCVPGLYGQ